MRRYSRVGALVALAAITIALASGLPASAQSASAESTYVGDASPTNYDVMSALAGQPITPPGSLSPPSGVLTSVSIIESGDPIEELSSALDPGGVGPDAVQVQFASVDSGPSPAAGPGVDPLTYIPFARDAVGYIYVGSSALGSLNQQQLTEIYEGEQPISGITVTPYLPQAGSGTRNFWLQVLGNPTLGTDVNQDPANEENTASVIGSLPAGTNAIYPFSISSWIAQSNGFSSNTGTSTVTLGNPAVGGGSDFIDPVMAGSSFGQVAPNPGFYSTPFGRDVYDVVSTADVTDFINGAADDDTDLLNQIASTMPVPAGATTPAIASPASLTIIHDFGFLSGAADGYAYDDEVGVSTAPTGPYTVDPSRPIVPLSSGLRRRS